MLPCIPSPMPPMAFRWTSSFGMLETMPWISSFGIAWWAAWAAAPGSLVSVFPVFAGDCPQPAAIPAARIVMRIVSR